MKNIVNVSIAGIAFKLEEEAYVRLSGYLQQIRDNYGNSSDGAEILGDLEARIAEIILTQQNATVAVSLSLIESTLERLGAPEDIADGASAENGEAKKESHAATSEPRIGHRMYRNSDGAKLGGVCNGLASYFDVDPVLVRLLFAAPLILMVLFYIIGWSHWGNTMARLMTTTFILYFLLWIVIPKAKTPLQKMEMRGEKITRDKLEQTFREEFQSRSNDPQNIQLRARNERNASVFSDFFSIIGRILLFCAKAFVAIIGFAFIITIVGIIVALIAVIAGGSGVIYGLTATSPALLTVLICLAVLIPLSLAVYGILKMLFGFSHNRPLVTTLMVTWILTLVFGTVIFIKDFENISFENGFHIGGREDNRSWQDKIWEKWQPDFADLKGKKELSQTHKLGSHIRSSTWTPVPIAGDTLWISPMDKNRMPDNFIVKIRREGHPYTEPVLAVRKFYKEKKKTVKIGPFSRSSTPKYLEQFVVEHDTKGDSLLFRVQFPDISQNPDERVEADLFLPPGKEAVVSSGINYNEYLDRK